MRLLLLLLLLLSSASRASAEDLGWFTAEGRSLLGPALDGPWFDFQRGLFLIVERDGKAYRVNPILLEPGPDRRLVNRYEGLVLKGRYLKGRLEFLGEDRPSADSTKKIWRMNGSLRLSRSLDRLDGAIRIDSAPYPVPPLPAQHITLRRHDRSPTLSVFRHGVARREKKPAPPSLGGTSIAVEWQPLPKPADVRQLDREPGIDIDPRHHSLTRKGSETWSFDREAAW